MPEPELEEEAEIELTMKHSDPQLQTFVYNLGKANALRCSNLTGKKHCGECEGCVLQSSIGPAKAWFLRCGDQTKRRFMLGLLKRVHSVDLLKHIINILQPLNCKDFMYAKVRIKPSLSTDRATMSNDRALNVIELERRVSHMWSWFENSNYWTKSNFLTLMLQVCEQHLMKLILTQAQTILASEEAAFFPQG